MRYVLATVIDRPIDDVWGFVSDFPFNLPRLRGSTLGLRLTSPGALGLGSIFESRVQTSGFEFVYRGVVTRFEPPSHVDFAVEGGPIRSGSVTMTLEPIGDRTQVTRMFQFELRLWARLLWPFLGSFATRRWDEANRNLKRLIESEPPWSPR
jgi:carbon monoxide dehydrogenase subunit G